MTASRSDTTVAGPQRCEQTAASDLGLVIAPWNPKPPGLGL